MSLFRPRNYSTNCTLSVIYTRVTLLMTSSMLSKKLFHKLHAFRYLRKSGLPHDIIYVEQEIIPQIARFPLFTQEWPSSWRHLCWARNYSTNCALSVIYARMALLMTSSMLSKKLFHKLHAFHYLRKSGLPHDIIYVEQEIIPQIARFLLFTQEWPSSWHHLCLARNYSTNCTLRYLRKSGLPHDIIYVEQEIIPQIARLKLFTQEWPSSWHHLCWARNYSTNCTLKVIYARVAFLMTSSMLSKKLFHKLHAFHYLRKSGPPHDIIYVEQEIIPQIARFPLFTQEWPSSWHHLCWAGNETE